MLQSKYVWKFLSLFGFHDCKPLSTPLEPGLHLSMHDVGEPIVDRSKYDVAVGFKETSHFRDLVLNIRCLFETEDALLNQFVGILDAATFKIFTFFF